MLAQAAERLHASLSGHSRGLDSGRSKALAAVVTASLSTTFAGMSVATLVRRFHPDEALPRWCAQSFLPTRGYAHTASDAVEERFFDELLPRGDHVLVPVVVPMLGPDALLPLRSESGDGPVSMDSALLVASKLYLDSLPSRDVLKNLRRCDLEWLSRSGRRSPHNTGYGDRLDAMLQSPLGTRLCRGDLHRVVVSVILPRAATTKSAAVAAASKAGVFDGGNTVRVCVNMDNVDMLLPRRTLALIKDLYEKYQFSGDTGV
jgi:hypothetical protein